MNARPEIPKNMPIEKETELDALLREFNGRYAVVNEAGKAIIYEETLDQRINRRTHIRITFEDFKRLYSNRRVEVGRDTKGRADFKTAAGAWLDHPNRRQFIGGVIFDPSGRNVRLDMLNLWRGFAVTPRPGSWGKLRGHVLDNICRGNAEHFDFLLKWMARLVQHPAEQGEVAVVMRGGEGTGKGTLAKALLHILGQHGIAISNSKHLTGNFNGHLRDTVLLFADEAFFAGDKAHVGVLKNVITEPFLTIEAKHQNAIQTPNFVHLIMASNEEWVVPASLDARRFFVLEVSNTRANDHAYFAAIWAEMNSGGYEAMLHELLNIDLRTYNPRRVPLTEGLKAQRKLSLPTAESWWLDVLHRGYAYRSRIGLEEYFGRWHEIVATEVLYESYAEYAKAAGERRPMSREQLGKFMKENGAKTSRPRNVVVGEHVADVPNQYGGTNRKSEPVTKDRATAYVLGSLAEARAKFEEKTRLTPDWPNDQEDYPLSD